MTSNERALRCRVRRSTCIRLRAAACIVALGWSAALTAVVDGGAEAAAGSPTHEVSRRRALLVGVTRYDHLDKSRQLYGPANDVVTFRELLTTKFGFRADEIHALAEAEGAGRRPTAERIRAEFRELADWAGAGDRIFILLSGHGSQQPDRDRDLDSDPEPDGYDEIFLPCDVAGWNGGQGVVENAIVDDEIRGWLTKMSASGAFVFFVADSCCSGTISRGEEATERTGDDGLPLVRSRRVPLHELHVPDVDGTSLARPDAIPDQSAKQNWLDAAERSRHRGEVVALYGCQADQESFVDRHPEDNLHHGRLTWTIHSTLAQYDRESPLTYRELAQRVRWEFARRRWVFESTPGVEGTNLDTAVLGVEEWPRRSQLRLVRVAGRPGANYAATEGFIHGLTNGSRLAVYPPAGAEKPEQLLGYVEVTKALPLESNVSPIDYQGVAAVRDFPDQSRCEVVYRDAGDFALTVGVETQRFLSVSDADALEPDLIDALNSIAAANPLIRVVEDSAAAWVAVATPEGAYLRRSFTPYARELDEPEARRCGDVFGRFEWEDSHTELKETLDKIARATTLCSMAEQAPDSRNPAVNVSLSLTRDGQPVEMDVSEVRDRQLLQLHITNAGVSPVSVVVLYVDNHYSITPFFPHRASDFDANRIGVGDALSCTVDFKINDTTVGCEHVIVVALSATQQADANDVAQRLAQSKVRTRGNSTGSSSDEAPGAFERLLDLSAGGATRSSRKASAPPIGSYAIRRITWNVVPRGPQGEQ